MKAKEGDRGSAGDDEITGYSKSQSTGRREICDRLRKLIDASLPKAKSKIWHGGPVWFIGENPVVGYSTNAKGVQLLFWNGQAFKDSDLKPIGKFGAAQATFGEASDINAKVVRRWLTKAKTDVFDSKAFFAAKRKNKS